MLIILQILILGGTAGEEVVCVRGGVISGEAAGKSGVCGGEASESLRLVRYSAVTRGKQH